MTNSNLFQKVFVKNTVISTSHPDNYVIENGKVFKIEEITKDEDGTVSIKCREILKFKCFYEKPISSIDLNIYEGELNQTFSEQISKTVLKQH